MTEHLRPAYLNDTSTDAATTNAAPSVDLPRVLDPAVILPPANEYVSEDRRKAVREWVFARVLEGLEAEELAAAGTAPTDYERHRADYRQGRHVAEQARNKYQWWFGEKWAEAAAAALQFGMTPGTCGHWFLCHDALQAVVRAYDVHEARMAGHFNMVTAPVARPRAAQPLVSTISSKPASRAAPNTQAPREAVALPTTSIPARENETVGRVAPSVTGSSETSNLSLDKALEETVMYKTCKGAKSHWCTKTVHQTRKAVALFKAVTGLTHTSEVKRAHVKDFRHFLCRMPVMTGRSIYKGLSAHEQIELADEMDVLRTRAKKGDKTAKRRIAERLRGSKNSIDDVCARLSAPTINRYLSLVGAIFEKPFDDDGVQAKEHPAFRSIQLPREKGRKGRVTPTQILNDLELEAIFETEKFQVEFRGKTERFWGLIVAGLHGVRRGEVAQFGPRHFDFSEVIPTVSLNHATMELKSEAGERIIPVHPLALDLGLEKIVRRATKHKQTELFPSFAWKENEIERGRDLTRWFAEVLEEAGINEPGKSLRSLRMGFNTDLTRGDCSDAKRYYLMGHAHEGVNLEHYFGGFRPEDVAPHIVNTRFAEIARRCLLDQGQTVSNVVQLSPTA